MPSKGTITGIAENAKVMTKRITKTAPINGLVTAEATLRQ